MCLIVYGVPRTGSGYGISHNPLRVVVTVTGPGASDTHASSNMPTSCAKRFGPRERSAESSGLERPDIGGGENELHGTLRVTSTALR